jgi:hypothetical protein
MKKAAEGLRPDKCGVIFERLNGDMVGTIVRPVNKIIKRQIKFFQEEGFRVQLQIRDGA